MYGVKDLWIMIGKVKTGIRDVERVQVEWDISVFV